jgi:hypothetical protein
MFVGRPSRHAKQQTEIRGLYQNELKRHRDPNRYDSDGEGQEWIRLGHGSVA